ncbi:MAG: RlmE family RNA methyltransferase [Sandaracinaceae bacterium]|nr:RlmE family RNA methyltransferase [Sandaracinaceae bacterium]
MYKLQEIDAKVGLLRRGMRVLDLGAYPGSWTTYAAEKVQREGKVRGYDLQPFRGTLPPHAEILRADVFELTVEELGGASSFEVVMSDMAPATSGHRFTDQARSEALVMRAFELATQVLAPGGSFVAKIFQGGDFQAVKKAIAERFDQVRVVRPDAVRRESIEVFLCATGFRAAEPSEPSSGPEG